MYLLIIRLNFSFHSSYLLILTNIPSCLQTVDDVLATTCKIESEGKARCCYPACNKLFKGIDFLKKHIKTKHEIFAADGMMRDAEPFIRSRYEALEPGMRPLPPVDVEVHGTIEQKGVSELWQGLFNKRIAGGGGGAVIVRENRGGRGEGRGGNERRAGGGGRGGGRERTNVQYIQPRAEENAGRTMSSYMDVDAPKVRHSTYVTSFFIFSLRCS